MIISKFITVAILGYLLGSIPFGMLIGRRKAGADIRRYGSGKTGATNVLRTAGFKAAVLVAGLDVSKGVLAVVFAGLIVGRDYLVVGNFGLGILVAQVIAALAAVVGHIWPVFLKFHGGREVATLVNRVVNSGQHFVNFNADNLSTGIYFYELSAGEFVQTNKMMLLK